MEHLGPPRPRVSRETRLLLVTVLVSIVTLWVLARIRFPDRPPTPNPVPPLFTQLAVRPRFEELAASVAELESRLLPALIALELDKLTTSGRLTVGERVVPALRIRNDVVVTLLDRETGVTTMEHSADRAVLARDPASGLAVVRVPAAAAPVLTPWLPQRMQYPRYFVESDVTRQGTSLRPVFVGSLSRVVSPTWSESIWAAPANTGLAIGAFVFTTDGTLAGLAIEHEGRPAILPADAMMRSAERLLREGSGGGGWLGLEVQALTPAIASVTGGTNGVVVTWVDPEGPAAGKLVVADVIETLGDQAFATMKHWEARLSRLAPGDSVLLGVRRAGQIEEVQLAAADPPPLPANLEPYPLGLITRVVPRVGVEVVRVDPGSAADRAGVQVGDVITLIGNLEGPTPAQITQAFLATPEDRALLLGITRGDHHRVLALGKR